MTSGRMWAIVFTTSVLCWARAIALTVYFRGSL